MAFFHRSAGELHCKIVYYGPGRGGKTTNLEYIHRRLAERQDMPLTRLNTTGDRTVYFDLLPLDLGTILGYRVRLHLYTVPGQPKYNASRRLVLRGVDGLVFVADSHPGQMFYNRESLENLRRNLAIFGRTLDSVPLIMQYNKRDLPHAVPMASLQALLNASRWPVFEAVAADGEGVVPTLKAVVGAVVSRLAAAERAAQPAASVRRPVGSEKPPAGVLP